MLAIPVVVSIALAIALVVVATRLRDARRERAIRELMFPPGVIESLARTYPHLALKDRQLVAHALRQFFLAYLRGGRRAVTMPSQAADDLWHAFILHTRAYDDFCRRAFGRFLHHVPAAALGGDKATNAGLRRVFWHACLEENINPRKPTRLPLLFALDRKLAIAGGFHYLLDCGPARAAAAAGGAEAGVSIHCASDMGDASVDGGTDGFGGDGGGAGGGGASGDGGDGGGGCGGE